MKKIVILTIATLALCGCSDSRPATQAQLNRIESKVDDLVRAQEKAEAERKGREMAQRDMQQIENELAAKRGNAAFWNALTNQP